MYLINVLTLEEKIIWFKTPSYEHKNGHIVFTDRKTGLLKSFPESRVTIDEVSE